MNTTPEHHQDGFTEMPAACHGLFGALVEVVIPIFNASMSHEEITAAAANMVRADPDAARLLCDYLSINEKKHIKIDRQFYGSSLRPSLFDILSSMIARQTARDVLDEIENLEAEE